MKYVFQYQYTVSVTVVFRHCITLGLTKGSGMMIGAGHWKDATNL